MSITRIYAFIFLIFLTFHSWALTPTTDELAGINNGRLEISVVQVGSQLGPYADGVNDDSVFFNRAIQLYKQYNKSGFVVLDDDTTYLIQNKVLIKEQPGVTIQGRGEGTSRSTLNIDIVGNIPGVQIYQADFAGLRKLRFISTANHTGDTIKVDRSGRARIHDMDFDGVYNGIRQALSNNLLVSKVKLTEPTGDYGFLGIGLAPYVDENNETIKQENHIFTLVDVDGVANNNSNFEWIRLGAYSVSYHLYDLDLDGGKNGIITSTAADDFPKYIFATNINISNTTGDGIHLKNGLDFQFSKFTVSNAGENGVYIGSGFEGGFMLSEPVITDSQEHGIYIGGGEQIQVFEPEIGHNSQASANTYSGIYVASGVDKFNVHYGVLGQLDAGIANDQKYGIELAGTMGTDHNYFSVVDVHEVGNFYTQSASSDPGGNWYFRPRTDRVTIHANDPVLGLPAAVAVGKDFPETFTYANPGTNTLQTDVNAMCALGGGTLWLKPGRYSLSSDLDIGCDNLRIHGSGRCVVSTQCSTIFFTGAAANVNIHNRQNVTINDVTFRSDTNNITHTGFALQLDQATNARITDNYFAWVGGAIDIKSSTGTEAINNYMGAIKTNGYLLRGTATDLTDNTTIFRTYMSDQAANGYGEGILTKIDSYTTNTDLIHTTSINMKSSLAVIDGSGSEPQNIKGYLVAADHNSKEGILLNAGNNIQLTNLWIGAAQNCNATAHSGIRINGADNVDIANAYLRGNDAHGLHVVNGDDIYAYNFMVGYNGRFKPSDTNPTCTDYDEQAVYTPGCSYDGIRLESNSSNVVLRGGTSGVLFAPWTNNTQRRGITMLSIADAFVKGIDLHDNCLSPAYGTAALKQYNPGWP